MKSHGEILAASAARALAAGHGDIALGYLADAAREALRLVAREEGAESAAELARLEIERLLGLEGETAWGARLN